jgi:flagellin-like protein
MRKGVSNIIGVAIMLAVGLSLAGLYSNWAPEFAQNKTEKIAGNANHEIKCRNAGISIQSPVYDKSSNLTLFELENSGTITLSEQIQIAALNNSAILNRTTVSSLEVGESRDTQIQSRRSPDMLIAASSECPSIDEKEQLIQIRN